MSKIANTKYPVLDIIKNRWSSRAFSEKIIAEDDLNTLFEAASWSPSANNEQPWQYYFAQKTNKANFEALLHCLNESNQTWAKNADVIICCVARKTFAGNQKDNNWARHDVGAANHALLLQAQSMDIHGHVMAGFFAPKAIETLHLSENQEPVTFLALGYLGNPEILDEPFKTRETAERQRKPLEEFIFNFQV